MHLREQLRRFEEELMQAKQQEREPMVRAMTQVLRSLKREHEEMLQTINHALVNLTSKNITEGVTVEEGRLMEKINRIIQPENQNHHQIEPFVRSDIGRDGGSTFAYLKKYNLLEEQNNAVEVSKENNINAFPTDELPKRIFSTPVSKILKNKPN